MPDTTDLSQANEALRQALAQPSLAARLITAVAGHLSAHSPQDELTPTGWGRALTTATIQTFARIPETPAVCAAAKAVAALPPAFRGITRGEYALRLHSTARGL
jgi:hypothetical protein